MNSPTLKLLNSSTVVAISGGLRVHIAFLLAGIEPNIMIYFGIGLIIYATYTLDRSLGSKEDAINKCEFIEARRRTAIIACIMAFLAGALILARENIYFASFFPFIVGYVYSKGIRIGKFNIKLKGGMGGKNIVIGLTWGGTIASAVSKWTENTVTEISIFLFFAIKLFINSTLNDFKDIKGDVAAGIKTLPVCLGKDRVRTMLTILCLLLHTGMVVALLMGFIKPELVILGYSFIVGIACTYFYISAFETKKLRTRKYLDSESAIALVIRTTMDYL